MINLGFYTGSGRNVRYQRTMFDYLLTGIAFLPVLVGWIYILYQIRQTGGLFFQENGAAGIVMLLLFLVLGCSMFVSVRYYRFVFRVTEANVGRQYVLAIRLCQFWNVAIGCMNLGKLLTQTCENAIYFSVFGVVLMAFTFVSYSVLAYKMR
ncbi:MAG TPA: hypothetical protein OIM59_14120 [Bacteroides mediterraneensis]|uniref:hypothetical protein n=1 Tax=Bacteroides mediterraneensis TaxID=1841856 RepID=UPI002608F3E8|nr:hypothetical protein [Bacteroides mediterraneensis]HJH65735.1 hypothetical protein [Bacteroides mediterraneensis]